MPAAPPPSAPASVVDVPSLAPPAPAAGPRRSDNPGALIAKILFGLFIGMCVAVWEPVAGLLVLASATGV